ncbi:Putative pleckstrin domain, Mcp5-type [Septoria linicola]|uniref:Pleckstrin domain, Mcp5-type n=1 Tax=Septoria linicola TaxID=215465 RepID=A0A9Q9ENE0_9PEZI|nr:Putative pleckstrin domain, Mcp5-type [Septoria linicola]
MADYFSEYSSFIGTKGLPSPADTPYETPGFIRSKRSSRVTTNSSREQSSSPPPLPPDAIEAQEKARDGRYSGMDPRRFTPTLHASLVSEILNLRRELDSKNNLVENLEVNLSLAKNENDVLNGQLAETAREVRKAKLQVQQIEQGTYDAVEDLVRERDNARATLEDLRSKLEFAQKKTRQQDEDAQRTQNIWETDKEAWDSERRQLERRIHVTETRLRAVVDEMAVQQSQVQAEELAEESVFKDSGFGNDSDTASIYSMTPSASPTKTKHRRNMSSVSFRQRQIRSSGSSRATAATPDLYFRPGNTLADELDIDEMDEYDNDGSVNGDETFEGTVLVKHKVASRPGSVTGELDAKAKRVLGLTTDSLESPTSKELPKLPVESRDVQQAAKKYQDRATTPPPAEFVMPEPAPRASYVDAGYQPSPPVSPPRVEVTQPIEDNASIENNASEDEMRQQPPPAIDVHATLQQPQRSLQSKPISPPETPVVDEGAAWVQHKAQLTVVLEYSTASTQTDLVEQERSKSGHTPKRDSLSPPLFVPSIAIHPPSSRPSSPRPYVLPPGTKNAFSQASLVWPSQDASIQTEEIRIDKRAVKLPAHLLPSALLPSPTFRESSRPLSQSERISASSVLTKRASINRPPAISIPASPPLQSPIDSSPEMARNNGARDFRHYPLKALPLPRPVLSPPLPTNETFTSNGPLNRSSQYGVTQPRLDYIGSQEPESSEQSDYDDPVEDNEPGDLIASMPVSSRPPVGRFGLSDPPKAVPEDKEISPERRPDTADSYGAAPAPSISSSRANSQRRHTQQPASRLGKSPRSPSFASLASSSQSAYQSEPLPPFPIPLRSSSRPKPHSEGSQSPTPLEGFGPRMGRTGRSAHSRQVSLRKVQSAAIIRNRNGRSSPVKAHRRRRRSPELTPVQSMAFESPAPTKFPIPDLPSPVRDSLNFNYVKGSVDLRSSPEQSNRVSEETNLVDAIAGTMVGEWMWKYIRKRKSFGIGDDTSELPVAAENGIVNVTAHGTRHKRWVWLSPYERTIMWDTKQPTSGPALLGKKGRKLAIQSVLDVQDRTPLPKNPELSSAWGRSILILTPERALKFTATTEERHGLWMTALTFLARESQLPNQIPPLPSSKPPPIPPMPATEVDGVTIKRHRSPSFGRSNVRDSIRLTKGKRPDLHKVQSHPDQPYAGDLIDAVAGAEPESADFPAVPRLYISTTRHQRNRSNTNPGFRSFSSSAVPSSASSAMQYKSTNASSFRPSISTKSGSRRESIASPVRQNFFEAVGTVRMEAFVDPNVRDGVLYVPAPPPVIGGARRPRRGSNLSQSTVDKRRAGYVFDEDGMDPFRGF